MDTTVNKSVSKRDCGCTKTTSFNDSENFNGYDTDREEVNINLCDIHKAELMELETEREDLVSRLNMIKRKINTINLLRNFPEY